MDRVRDRIIIPPNKIPTNRQAAVPSKRVSPVLDYSGQSDHR
jgi:hypothetical protein